MTAIDERRLDTDLLYRFEYLREFIDFRMGDIAAIHAAAPVLAPSCPAWSMPFTPSSSSTCQHCGIYCPANGYFATLVTRPYEGTMGMYLDRIGRIHTVESVARIQIPPSK
jgi:hypothetical protein